jgi:hypothetical protein
MTEALRPCVFAKKARPQDLNDALHQSNGTSKQCQTTRTAVHAGADVNLMNWITFLGTRGEIRGCSRLHRRPSCIMVEHGKARVMIDCGAQLISRVSPTAIVLTHAHPDHARGVASWRPLPGLRPCAPVAVAARLAGFRPPRPLQKSIAIAGVRFEALPVEHSIPAPAVRYRVSANGVRFFTVPDVVRLRNRPRAQRGVDLSVGDGASITRPIIRRRRRAVIGHSSIRAQLDWCNSERPVSFQET